MGTRRLLALTAALALLGVADGAWASMSAAPTERGVGVLESGGSGCYDPESWVWQAPRAERVARPVAVHVPCEIGVAGCERRAESVLFDDIGSTAADQVCNLKLALHERADRREDFDSKSCLETERMLLSIDDIEPVQLPRTRDGLACQEDDPECRPMPPVPQPETSVRCVTASAVIPKPLSQPRLAVLLAISWELGQERPGVGRRVDRPPPG